MFACLLLTHGVQKAWAQDEEEEGASEEEEGSAEEAPAEGEESAEEATEEATSEEEAPADAGGRWPRAVLARPLTLPKSLIRVGGALSANNDFSALGLTLQGGYGVSDDLEVFGSYAFSLKEFEAKGSLNAGVGYKILKGSAGDKLDGDVRVQAGYNVLGEGLNPLVAGLEARYKLSDKLAVYMPGTHLLVSLDDQVIVVGMTTVSTKPIAFRVPVGVEFQATPELYVSAITQIANIDIKDSANAFIFADTTPLALTAVYNAKPNLDAFVGISTDLTNEPGDTLGFLVGANYYMGAL
jgi:hypothetical protein